VSSEGAILLGQLVNVQAQLQSFQPSDTKPWLGPWSGEIARISDALEDGRKTLFKHVSGTPDPKGLKSAQGVVNEATRLYDLIRPIHESVLAANAGLSSK
jgi:hypothetical protein